MLRIADFLLQLIRNLIDVDGIVPEKYPLLLVNTDHQALFGDFLHRAGFGNSNLDPRLQHRRRDHEDNQQYKDNVHQRSDVDVGESNLRAPIGSGESHYRRTSSGMRAAAGWRSTAFSISSEKSSHRAANSRIDPPIRL